MGVKFILNGREVESGASPSARLLDVVRNEFGLTGAKCGCKEGECGACSVLMDGLLVNSCMVAIGTLPGHEVTTIEGFAKPPASGRSTRRSRRPTRCSADSARPAWCWRRKVC
jgi:aerobic-type carbon monoxide dehydrogenase small subunit (CoxS/CutS family)